MPGDVYDFHEDSGDETATSPNKTETRPRLILTIKSPLSGHSSVTATSTLSIAQKEQMKFIEKTKEEKNEEFISPSTHNTRKSRRLQEKDVQRSTVDDVIEDVIKGPVGSVKTGKETNKKRPSRQAVVKTTQEKPVGFDTRKSPRGAKRTRDRSLSDASMDSGDERNCIRDPKAPRLEELEPEPASASRSAALLIQAATAVSAAPVVPANPASLPIAVVAAPLPQHAPSAPHAPSATLMPLAIQAPPAPQPPSVTQAPPLIQAPPVIQAPSVTQAPPTPNASPVPHVPHSAHAPHVPLTPQALPASVSTSTPITKPPKKMISEISAKLAGAFDGAVAASTSSRAAAGETPSSPLAPGGGDAARGRRMADGVPGALVPVGATEASDARVQSPALPHRPPSAPCTPAPRGPPERATPLLIRSVARAPARVLERPADQFDEPEARAFRYAATASLPRGAAHPPPDHVLHHPGQYAHAAHLLSISTIHESYSATYSLLLVSG